MSVLAPPPIPERNSRTRTMHSIIYLVGLVVVVLVILSLVGLA
ncbi:hypothetical protein [Fodinicurvata sp. EGI_FJ10296]